ncbi:hypothetical protein N7532_008892 [Penicillium argentinense]|uniref:Uncharacterized protein n=1 Tax=Penicillium argentinense TaxID=1131581 RepID=A0A9W9K236_9EURO|nr:uncharacterized protein N7532_008892 [Penicillium argentinense]KAJ5090208.1 hypothetical protein N7532_008892 [Penicillium argentinense]
MTGHFSLFKECTDHIDVSSSIHEEQEPNDSQISLPNVIPVEPADIQRGALPIQLLQALPVYRRSADVYLAATQDCEFLGRPLVERTFESLQQLAKPPMSGTPNLDSRSREKFRHFSKPARWEIVGLAFSFVGLSILESTWRPLDDYVHAGTQSTFFRGQYTALALKNMQPTNERCIQCRLTAGNFLGRPSRISWRFFSIALPLNISFTEVITEPSLRDAAIRKLDTDGWNTVKNDVQAVWLRCVLLMGPVRESILELSLNRKVKDLPQRIEEVWESLPPFLHRRHDPDESSGIANVKESVYLQAHLDYIYDQFLLYRILSKRLNIWSPDLIKASHDILSEILLLVDTRIQMMRLSPEITWVKMCVFGLPTAGVLSIELVHRWPSLSMNAPISPPIASPQFPRSLVIQNLTILA